MSGPPYPGTRPNLTLSVREVRGKNKLVAQVGYTKSVDMWSLGCLTTALLSGSSYFVNTQDSEYRRDSTAAVTKAAAECNLAGIDNDIDWEEVETLAKDFIKQLLKLDEKARLSAEQALEHAWFTEGPRRIFFQESYEKIIHGWTRSTPGWDFIENLDQFIDARNPQSKVRYAHSPL